MEFYFPTELGEQLAFSAAVFSSLIGLLIMFAPMITFRLFGLQLGDRRDGLVLIRSSLAGFYLGFGATALLLQQIFIYMALGFSFAVAVFGAVLSILSDGGATMRNLLLLVVHLILSALPLAYVFGLV